MYIGTIFVNGSKATMVYGETIVDTDALMRAVEVQDFEGAKKIRAAAKRENRTRSYEGDVSVDTLASFAASVTRVQGAVVTRAPGDDSNVYLVSSPPPAKAKK